jgi:hypothetical protein
MKYDEFVNEFAHSLLEELHGSSGLDDDEVLPDRLMHQVDSITDQVQKLINSARDFDVDNNSELAIEGNPGSNDQKWKSEFDKMSEEEREQWWTSIVVAVQSGTLFADNKSAQEFDAFLRELREKLLGY